MKIFDMIKSLFKQPNHPVYLIAIIAIFTTIGIASIKWLHIPYWDKIFGGFCIYFSLSIILKFWEKYLIINKIIQWVLWPLKFLMFCLNWIVVMFWGIMIFFFLTLLLLPFTPVFFGQIALNPRTGYNLIFVFLIFFFLIIFGTSSDILSKYRLGRFLQKKRDLFTMPDEFRTKKIFKPKPKPLTWEQNVRLVASEYIVLIFASQLVHESILNADQWFHETLWNSFAVFFAFTTIVGCFNRRQCAQQRTETEETVEKN